MTARISPLPHSLRQNALAPPHQEAEAPFPPLGFALALVTWLQSIEYGISDAM